MNSLANPVNEGLFKVNDNLLLLRWRRIEVCESCGKEEYNKSKDIQLPYEVEHIYPDYSLYNITDTAYGYLTRGCPRGCKFCHVEAKEGRKSYKCADLKEFWNGQKNIELLDPNTLACKDWKDILQQLIDSKAKVNFTVKPQEVRVIEEKIK